MQPFNRDDPSTWGNWFRPPMIAHDVGSSVDRSTFVYGGNGPFDRSTIGIVELGELPQGLRGYARASALADVDRRLGSEALIIADFTYDPSYADILFELFGPRLIGLHITRSGEGLACEHRRVKNGSIRIYCVGRSYLLENLRNLMEADRVRLVAGPMAQRAFAQLEALETEIKESGIYYRCLPGQHDDLGMSMAMLVWAAPHPHLRSWFQTADRVRRPRKWCRLRIDSQTAWRAFT